MALFPSGSGGGSYRLVETATGTSSEVATKIAKIETAYDGLTDDEKANAFIVLGATASLNGARYVNNGSKKFENIDISFTDANNNQYMVSQLNLSTHTHLRYSYGYSSGQVSQGINASNFGSALYLYTK